MAITKYKGVVIGAGAIGALLEAEPRRPKPASHAGALSKNKKTELVAIVDSDQAQLKIAQMLFPKARVYTSYEEALEKEQPDIVAIATPARSHYELIAKAVTMKVRMIICEKPLATSEEEALKIQILLAGTDTVFVLNYQRRFFTLFKEVKERITKGELGNIQHVTCYYSNGLYNNGGHTIDALEYLLDEPITEMQGRVVAGLRPEGDENINTMLGFKSGAQATLVALDQDAYGIHEFRIYGTKGEFLITDYGYTFTTASVGSSLFLNVNQLDYHSGKRTHRKESMVAGALEEAMRSYEKHETPVSGVDNGIRCLKVLDSIRQSAQEEGKIITLND